MTRGRIELAVGPLLFNWPADQAESFYRRLEDHPGVDRVYLGEVVCGKRGPLLAQTLATAAERLAAAGKTVVWSSLSLPANARELRAMRELVESDLPIEVNDLSALAVFRAPRPFVAGPLLNIYNEAAARELTRRGCRRLCANVEVPLSALQTMAAACPGLEIELFAYGRLPLALSSRCHHAHLHGLHKDSCQFVCGKDSDGLDVATLEGEGFLALNGVQTLSYGVQALDVPPAELRAAGVRCLRLSPHSGAFGRVVESYRAFLDEDLDSDALRAALLQTCPPGPLVNGYLRGRPGMTAA